MKVGAKVPDFSLPATGNGGTWRLKDARDQKVVLYFYPKDMTTGCTRESQDFRDLNAAFRKAGVRVVGVSRDSLKSHEKFRDKEKLPFDLLSDEEEKLQALRCHQREDFVWQEVPGRREEYLPHRRLRCVAPGMAESESARSRGGSP